MSPPSALPSSPANGSADLLSVLSGLLLRLRPDSVILLRPLADHFDFRRDDVDLLLADRQRTELLGAAFEASAAGKIHLRVCQNSPVKVQLILWDLECTSSLTVDLWSAFTQLPGHRGKMIRADRLLNLAESTGCSTRRLSEPSKDTIPGSIRLPADIDFCLLVLHLVSKRKPVSNLVVRERLLAALDRLRGLTRNGADLPPRRNEIIPLLQAAESILRLLSIPPRLVMEAEAYLLERIRAAAGDSCTPIPETRGKSNFLTSVRRWLMQRIPCVAIVGSDGAGKSSVSQRLAGSKPSGMSQIVARKLYRRSLLYQFAGGIAKRTKGTDRGQFDDLAAPWITLRASVSLWLQFVLRAATTVMVSLRTLVAAGLRTEPRASTAGLPPQFIANLPPRQKQIRLNPLLLDRSVAGFLIRDRKTDTPRLHWSAVFQERFIPPVTTVLLTVSFADLVGRRLEMTRPGHHRYQELLFHQALRQSPSDVIVIANTRTADDAAHAILQIDSNRHVPSTTRTAERAAA